MSVNAVRCVISIYTPDLEKMEKPKIFEKILVFKLRQQIFNVFRFQNESVGIMVQLLMERVWSLFLFLVNYLSLKRFLCIC